MPSPYKIEGPALISFSGGRTSAFMLHEIIRAHNGILPPDVYVVFANTGKEREETLRFVHGCEGRWGVPIEWVEHLHGEDYRTARFHRASFGLASRHGEPFARLLEKKKRAPNWQERWCTQLLKVVPMHAFMLAETGLHPGEYAEVIGLRDDEGPRILTGMERADRDSRKVVYPLARAKVRKPDVFAFWAGQSFGLDLASHEGNCDLCFLKGRGIRKRIIRDRPHCAKWWSQQETLFGRFDRRDSVADLVDEVGRAPEFTFDDTGEEHDAECGLHCGAAA